MKFYISFLAILVFAFAPGCGKSQKEIESEKSLNEAVSALKKVQASTEVGVNFQQYGNLLIDAKAKVNEASGKIETPEVKNNLEEAMLGYLDAAQFWQYKIKSITVKVVETGWQSEPINYKFDSTRTMNDIVQKYQLNVKSLGNAPPNHTYVEPDAAMQACWLWSRVNLSKVEEASNKK